MKRRKWVSAMACCLTALPLCGDMHLAQSEPASAGPNAALMDAVGREDFEAVKEAIARRANVNLRYFEEGAHWTLLCYACGDYSERTCPNHDERIPLILISHGANVNARNDDGNTPLMAVADDGFYTDNATADVAEALIAHGADIHVRDKLGRSALLLAAQDDNLAMVKCLFHHGVDLDERDKAGRSALSMACWTYLAETRGMPSADAAQFLVEHGADANVPDETGRTPLMWLARVDPTYEGDALRVARDLVKHGANVGMRNRHDKTAYEVASANGLKRLAAYLKSVEARLAAHPL